MKFVSIIIGIFFFVGSLSADKYVRVDGLKNICLRLEVRDINLALYKDETLSDLPNVYTEVALRYPDGKCGSFEMTFREDIILLDRFLDELLPLIQSKNPIDKKEREALRCLRLDQHFEFSWFNPERGKSIELTTSCGPVHVVKREEDGGFYFFRHDRTPYPELYD